MAFIRKISKIVSILTFQVGVNVIGLPCFHEFKVFDYKKELLK